MPKKKKDVQKNVQKEVKENMEKVSETIKPEMEDISVINEEIFLTIEEKFQLEFHLEKIKSSKLEREASEQKLLVKKLSLENFKLQMNMRLKQFEDEMKEIEKEVDGRKTNERIVKEQYVKEVSSPLRKKYGLGEHFSFDPLTGQVMVTQDEPERKK